MRAKQSDLLAAVKLSAGVGVNPGAMAFDPLRAIQQIESLGFSEEEKRMILGGNAARLFGLGSPGVRAKQ